MFITIGKFQPYARTKTTSLYNKGFKDVCMVLHVDASYRTSMFLLEDKLLDGSMLTTILAFRNEQYDLISSFTIPK